jgi:hypothetical protein
MVAIRPSAGYPVKELILTAEVVGSHIHGKEGIEAYTTGFRHSSNLVEKK